MPAFTFVEMVGGGCVRGIHLIDESERVLKPYLINHLLRSEVRKLLNCPH